MTRHTTFCFTLQPTVEQEEVLRRHVGAARFAFNQSLRIVKDALDARRSGADGRVPWSGFDLINAFNRWKISPDAGIDEHGNAGLAWRGEVLQQVFEEGAVDLGRALAAFSAGRTAGSHAVGFPKFKSRYDARQSCRTRNKGAGNRASIRIGAEGAPRSIRLPKLGVLAVRESTRNLRRMLAKGRAKILFATISKRIGGRWRVSVNVEPAALHPAERHTGEGAPEPIGIDRGLRTFAVLADAEGREIERIDAPRPLRRSMRKLRQLSRAESGKKKRSRNRFRARARLAKHHQRIANRRRHFVHGVSTRLAKTHGQLVLETLSTAGLMKTRMARSLADSAWAEFARVLTYKLAWRGGTVQLADRFYPSTRRCSACGEVGDAVPLPERTFRCSSCGH